jgi:two-component system CitB family sensor kinase
MSTTAPARRRRLGLPRKVFSQVLLMQLAIAAGVAVLATGLFLAPLGHQLDDQAMRRALAIAATTAENPQVVKDLLTTRPTVDGPVQREAERIRKATGAEYVVVMDRHGIRWSHSNPRRVGGHVSTDPGAALAGRKVMGIDTGTLGRSARGKVPLYDGDHRIVGAVSVGIAYDSVRSRLIHAVPGLLAYAGGALAAGALAAWLISRRVQRSTRDLAFSDIAALLAEREAARHPGRGRGPRPRGPGAAAQRRGPAPAGHRRRGARPVAGRDTGRGPYHRRPGRTGDGHRSADRAGAAGAGRQPDAHR